MGIFDFLRGSREKKELKKVRLEQVRAFIDSFYENLTKEVKSELTETRENLSEEKNKLKENITILEEAELKHKAFPESVIPMMRDNRKTYIQKIRKFTDGINIPAEIEDISKFCDNYEIILNEFSKNTLRNYEILKQFFGEKIVALTKNISKINGFIKEAGKLAKESKIEEANELKNKLKEIQEEIKHKKDAEEEMVLEKEELRRVEKNLVLIESKIKENEQGERHKNLILLIEKKKETEKEIREIEKEPLHSFSVINDALKKYERISLEQKLIKRYLENPLKTLEEDNGLKIIEIVSKMKEAIINDKIDLKKEKKGRIVNECDIINKTYLESFLRRNNELNKKLNEISSGIENETLIKEIEASKEELRKEKIRFEETEHKLKKMNEELKKINIDKLRKELETEINKEMNENVKISS